MTSYRAWYNATGNKCFLFSSLYSTPRGLTSFRLRVRMANELFQGPRSNFEMGGRGRGHHWWLNIGGGKKHFFLLVLYNFKNIGRARAPQPPPPPYSAVPVFSSLYIFRRVVSRPSDSVFEWQILEGISTLLKRHLFSDQDLNLAHEADELIRQDTSLRTTLFLSWDSRRASISWILPRREIQPQTNP